MSLSSPPRRVWRFIFLQEREGYFEPTASLAFAMLALRPKQLPKKKVFTGVMKYIMKVNREDNAEMDVGTDSSEDEIDGDARKGGQGSPDDGVSRRHPHRPTQKVPKVGLKRGQHLVLEQVKQEDNVDDELVDCPLTYSAEAIRKTVPRVLSSVNDRPRPPRKGAKKGAAGKAGAPRSNQGEAVHTGQVSLAARAPVRQSGGRRASADGTYRAPTPYAYTPETRRESDRQNPPTYQKTTARFTLEPPSQLSERRQPPIGQMTVQQAAFVFGSRTEDQRIRQGPLGSSRQASVAAGSAGQRFESGQAASAQERRAAGSSLPPVAWLGQPQQNVVVPPRGSSLGEDQQRRRRGSVDLGSFGPQAAARPAYNAEAAPRPARPGSPRTGSNSDLRPALERGRAQGDLEGAAAAPQQELPRRGFFGRFLQREPQVAEPAAPLQHPSHADSAVFYRGYSQPTLEV